MADAAAEKKVLMIDPSLVFRPEEAVKKSGGWKFRNFDETSEDPHQVTVRNTYMKMHTNQCVDYVKRKHKEWEQFNKFEATIMEALEKAQQPCRRE
ncbi:hypothetical protein O3P69_020893 [Scylla paramamosain]|uniref:Inositol oxygenase n=1 Tax=Scylla paramamosain TaxID=85552 RepID=A0AAW0TPQ0_SCYPA